MVKQAMQSSRTVFFPTPNPLPPLPPPLPQPLPSPPNPSLLSLSPPSLPPSHSHALHSIDSSISLSLPSTHHPATVSSSFSTSQLHLSHIEHRSSSTAVIPPHSSKDPSPHQGAVFADHNDHQSHLPQPQPHHSHHHIHHNHHATRHSQSNAKEKPENTQSRDQIEKDPSTSSRQNRRRPSLRLRQRAHREAERQRHIRARRQTYVDSTSEDDQPVSFRKHKPSTKSLNYFSKLFHRLCHFPCAQPSSGKGSLSRYHSGSHSSVYLPRLTSAQPSPGNPSHTGANRAEPRRQHNRVITSRTRDKGKHRAGSLPAVLAETEGPHTALSSLSLVTTHSWCPYCVKVTPGEGVAAIKTHNHNSHRHLTTYLATHSRNPSLGFTSSVYSDSLRSYPLTEDDSTSLSDVELSLPDTLFTYSHPLPHHAPSTAKPQPIHSEISLNSTPPQLEITPSTPLSPSPPRGTSNVGLKSRPLSYPTTTDIAPTITFALASNPPNTNQPKKTWWKGKKSQRQSDKEDPPSSSLYKSFLKGFERTPWFSSGSSKPSPIHHSVEEVPRKIANKRTDLGNTSSKRRSWSVFPIKRRASWFQSEVVGPSTSSATKRQTEKNRLSTVYTSTDRDKVPDYERRDRQEEETRPAKVLPPILDQKAANMLATQQESFMTHHPHTHHPHHMLASNTGRQLGFSANSILMDQKASLEKLESRKSVDRMRAASDVLPHSRPQALVQAHLLAQGQPSTQAPTPSTPQVKHQRRRSFLPSALMTSNLAKFVSGHSNSPLPTSPASAQSPQSSQSATSRSSPLKLEEEPTSQILTVDQFKWSVGCCCHEIKSKAMKQRSLTKDQQSQTSIPGATPSPLPSPPTPRKHEWTKPRRYTNSSPPPPRDDSKDARPVLQALLQVMATTQESTQDLGSSSRLSDSLYGQSPHSSQMRLPQQPSRNHSLLSFMGSSASSNALPAPFPDPSSSPLRQYQTYEISVSNARPQTIESQRFSWTPSAHSLASHISSPVESLDRSRHLSPSIATSTDSNPYPGCEAILGPMTVQDLVRLLAFILSVAPEQWIPWHLYDFFVRPQGRTYRDLVELLPTQSQKVLRTILATVDLLVDFAVATERQQISSAHSSTPVSSAGKVPGAHLRSKSDAFDSRDAMATVSEHASFGSMAESTLEQQPVNTTDPSKRNTSGGEILSTANVNAATIRSEILSQRMQVIRGLKRTAIIDHLSDSVFRSRQDVAMQMYGYPSSPSPGRESPSFNLRRSSMPSPRPRASTIAVPQGSELERASALQAFENLVSAYEDEYYPRRSKATTQPLSTSGTLEDTEARDHGEMRPSLMLLSRSLSSTAPRSGSGSEPGSRHMRTPTSFSPIPESDASNSRSLSLPPWRKQSPLAMTTESRRPKLESSVSSPGPSSQEVSRVPLIESKSAVGLAALGADLLKREALIQPVPQPPQLAPLRLLILEEEEILIRDTSDEESFSEGEGMDDEEIEGELRDHDDTCLGQRSSRLAMDATEEAERDADNKARDEDLRDLLAQGLSLLKYKRRRRLKKESSTFGDLTVYDQWGGEGGGGPSGPTKPQASEQDIDDDADISENEV